MDFTVHSRYNNIIAYNCYKNENKGEMIIMFDVNKMGEQIARLRKGNNYTQEQLAEKLKVSPQAVSKWENGV